MTRVTQADIQEGRTLDLGSGYTARVECPYDDDTTPPWKREDGHGPVSEWRPVWNRHTGCRDKRPGEMLLVREGRGTSDLGRFYDFAAAVKLARRDGWGYHGMHDGETPGERAHKAALADFEYLRRWCNDEWHYIGVVVTVHRNGEEIGGDALWGIEDCPNPANGGLYYWREVAAEMIEGIVTDYERKRKADAIRKRRETRERRHWEARGVVTR